MRHVGHTMATPDLEIRDAIELFAELGLQATEVISRTLAECGDKHGEAAGEARIFSFEWDDEEVNAVVRQAADRRVPFVTVTQYIKAVNDPKDENRAKAVEQIDAYMAFARMIRAQYVRVYGGADGFGEDSWPFMVESLRELARRAAASDLTLLIENHPGTLTVTGEATAKLIEEVGSPAVRSLYDPANVLCHSDEPWDRTFDIQREMIAYVHVKDFAMVDGKRVACPVGEGDVPWDKIVPKLVGSGYDGYLSYEYEKKWNPTQLPPSREGLTTSVSHIKSLLG